MLIETKSLQLLNAPSPITVMVVGMIVFLHPTINSFCAVSIIALQLSRESYVVLPDSTTILVKPEVPANASFPMVLTEFGMVSEDISEHELNALSPIMVTVLGIIVALHPEISLFVDVSMIALQPSLESYTALSGTTTMLTKLLQPENTPSRIEVTDLGIVTEVKSLQ